MVDVIERKKIREHNNNARRTTDQRTHRSLTIRERHEVKRQQLLAEIAAIDISHRVMSPEQLEQYREETRKRIGAARPAEVVEA